jgi:hypothetical protein
MVSFRYTKQTVINTNDCKINYQPNDLCYKTFYSSKLFRNVNSKKCQSHAVLVSSICGQSWSKWSPLQRSNCKRYAGPQTLDSRGSITNALVVDWSVA